MGLSPFSIDRLRAGSNLTVDGFTLWLENGQLQSSRTRPSEPDWQLDGSPPTELDQPDEYTVPEDDPTGRCWLSSTARSTKHKATPGTPLDRDAAQLLHGSLHQHAIVVP